MKIAVLSDIHGNIEALKTVLVDMKREGVERVFSLGDFIGYYDGALEVFEELKRWKADMISGNHEQIFLSFLNENDSYRKNVIKKYGTSYLKYEKKISSELVHEISELPLRKEIKVDDINFLLCHGSPKKYDEYMYPDATPNQLRTCDTEQYDFIFMGHTHHPMVYRGKKGMLINVGSVGQSRTVGGIANWGIIDTGNRVYMPKQTPYDVTKLERKLKEANEREYLYKILRKNNNV